MKKKQRKKFFAFVLGLIMILSSSISTSAAEKINVTYKQIDYSQNITVDANEILANAEAPMATSIPLPASKSIVINLGYLSVNQTVDIYIKWTPSSSALHMGLSDSPTSGTLFSLTGGSKVFSATIHTADTYYLIIKNPSTTTSISITALNIDM